MYTYSQHQFLRPVRVAGLRLHPFTLGHADVLCGLGSPVYTGKAPSPSELAAAFFVCSRPWKTALEQISDGSDGKELKRTERRFWRMKPARLDAMRDLFSEYLGIFSVAPPRWEEAGGGGSVARAPWHLAVFCILQEKTNFQPLETWNLTVARAFELAAVIGANQGDDKLVSVAEMAIYDKMMAPVEYAGADSTGHGAEYTAENALGDRVPPERN